jgi:hypothetical protein
MIWCPICRAYLYVDEMSARATLEAMQMQGPPLPKVDVKALFDIACSRDWRMSG